MTSPSDILVRAADLIRDTAAKATKNVCPDWTYHAIRHVARNCNIDCGHDQDAIDGLEHYGWDRYNDAPWYQLMSPAVAQHVERWLRETAAIAERSVPAWQNSSVDGYPGPKRTSAEVASLIEHHYGAALGIARAVLGFPEDGEN